MDNNGWSSEESKSFRKLSQDKFERENMSVEEKNQTGSEDKLQKENDVLKHTIRTMSQDIQIEKVCMPSECKQRIIINYLLICNLPTLLATCTD